MLLSNNKYLVFPYLPQLYTLIRRLDLIKEVENPTDLKCREHNYYCSVCVADHYFTTNTVFTSTK